MRMTAAQSEEDRLAFALKHLREILLRQMPEEGTFVSAIPDVGMARRDQAGFCEHRFDRPLVSLLAQGRKETVINGKAYKLEPLELLTVCVDMPSSSRILSASSQTPLLAIYFYLNPHIINELSLELDNRPAPYQYASGVFKAKADASFAEQMLQLAAIVSNGERARIKAKILLKYLHLLILTGENGDLIRSVYARGAKSSMELFSAIKYLRENLDCVVSIKELAGAANMSESSIYRHFKSLIGISPLQYHKQLRLHKARELIMSGGEQIAAIAYKVGYESVSQFSREYKKLFGLPPKKSNRQY